MSQKASLLLTVLVLALVAFALLYKWDPPEPAGVRIQREIAQAPLTEPIDGPTLTARGEGSTIARPPTTEGALSALVVACDTRKPIPRALIGMVNEKAHAGGEPAIQGTMDVLARTDPSGRALVPAAQVDAADLIAVAPGFLPARAAIAPQGTDTVICLERGVSIGGTVVDKDGAPVTGAVIRAIRPGMGSSWPQTDSRMAVLAGGAGNLAVSDERGAFELRGLLSGASYELTARAKGHSQGAAAPPLIRAPLENVLIPLVPQCAIRLRFVDDTTGRPVSPLPDVFFVGGGAADPRLPKDLTDGEMAFSMVPYGSSPTSDLPPTAGLVVRRLGYERVARRLPLPWTKSSSSVIRLKRSTPRFSRVRLTARFPGGLRYEGTLNVTIQGTNDTMTSEVTFVEGRATRAIEVPPGRLAFTSSGGRGAADWYWRPIKQPIASAVALRPEEQPVDLDLQGQPIRLSVVDHAGRSYRRYDVFVQAPKGRIVSSGWYRGWATAARGGATTAAGKRESASHGLLWLPPGENTVRVNVPEVGSGGVVIKVRTDGAPARAVVRLTAPPVDYRRRPAQPPK